MSLSGPMGSGKTAFASGIAEGLGFPVFSGSPTYTIVNEYSGDIPLFHFDLFRLSDMDDLYDIGWDDYLGRGGVIVVEWPEIAGEELEADVFVSIEPIGENSRQITVEGLNTDEDPGF